MPRGWYLAQGMIPLGYSSSDDEEGPCELPDGRVVCGPHGQVVCGRCCLDFSDMEVNIRPPRPTHTFDWDEDDDEDDARDTDSQDSDGIPCGPGPNLVRGTGRVFPTKFVPPSTSVTPIELFTGRRAHMSVTRYTLPNDTGTGLAYTDGACLNNGQANPRAGYSFWHGIGPSGNRLVVSARLEKKGPFGDEGLQTSNRAELRAVISLMRFRYWPGEGFHTFVIATDSEYVVEGATEWARTWTGNGWMTSSGPVKNKDLWEVLLGAIERFKDGGMAVKFWRIPREWNTVADEAAKEAAAGEDAPDKWSDIYGMNI